VDAIDAAHEAAGQEGGGLMGQPLVFVQIDGIAKLLITIEAGMAGLVVLWWSLCLRMLCLQRGDGTLGIQRDPVAQLHVFRDVLGPLELLVAHGTIVRRHVHIGIHAEIGQKGGLQGVHVGYHGGHLVCGRGRGGGAAAAGGGGGGGGGRRRWRLILGAWQTLFLWIRGGLYHFTSSLLVFVAFFWS